MINREIVLRESLGRFGRRVLPILVWALIAYGEQARSIRGTVTDEKGHALAGAVVQIQDKTTLQIRSYVTQENGAYHFADLSPDLTYHLRANYSGVSSRSKIVSKFDSHIVSVVNLTIRLSK